MHFNNQKILPAAKSIREFEKLMKTKFEYIILLDCHVAQLQALMSLANRHRKKVLLHVDLIQGLRSDEYAAEFLCQTIKPAGLISTRTPVVSVAKKKSLIAIQRIFLLDTHALETSYRLLQSFKPDYIEVLPGIIPHIIKEVSENTGVPVLAGGLIRTIGEVEEAIQAGAVAATTSSENIWRSIK
ncbi:glycerol-3-phosphate responsive antiterminator [Lihuaxuella thermophila]|uniref:Glycerol uptake operon antiterminator regulatory protein n=1 Tax=Lihuaxuella thermophila TaxID=1173111 RepID=A0A1H8JLF2_9BACL|nr:glycerol-3-phosphate responsive antiterminator [Lihuaxuella thermophila]SEN81489.1 glycerol uptake operon antiterminator [Lihuaxuella thermophila]